MTVPTRELFLEVYYDDIQDVYSEVMETLDSRGKVTFDSLRKFKHLTISLGFKGVSDVAQEAFDHPETDFDEYPEVAPDTRPGCWCTLDIAKFTELTAASTALVKMFLETNCPSCRQFTRTCMANIMNADGISEILDFEYISFGYGTIDEAVPDVRNRTKTDEVQLDSVDELKPVLHTIEDISMRGTSESMKPALTVSCPHGSDECISDMYQACVQDVSPTQKEAFAVFLCMEDKFCDAASRTRGEQGNSSCDADPGETAHACLMDVAPHLAELVLACMKGDRKRELLVMNDIATMNARPQFLPWITVDGRALGMSEQFLLGKHICHAYVEKTGELSGLCSGTPFAALRPSATAHACPRTGVAPHALWGYHQLLPP